MQDAHDEATSSPSKLKTQAVVATDDGRTSPVLEVSAAVGHGATADAALAQPLADTVAQGARHRPRGRRPREGPSCPRGGVARAARTVARIALKDFPKRKAGRRLTFNSVLAFLASSCTGRAGEVVSA